MPKQISIEIKYLFCSHFAKDKFLIFTFDSRVTLSDNQMKKKRTNRKYTLSN